MSIFSSNRDTKEPVAPPSAVNPAATKPSGIPSTHQTAAPTPSYSAPSSPVTTISEGTKLDGQIKIEGDIKIEGHIKGTVTSKGKVIISGSGKVDGDIICQSAEIAGTVGGKLKIADILFLKGNATIDGDINTGKLVIENGVKFNGNCSMGVPAAATTTVPKVNLNANQTVELKS
jgi:cytoskeletal protein CcmA (bactofilin family)